MLGRAFATLTVIAVVALSGVSGAAPAPAQPAPTVLTLAPAFFPMPADLLRGEVFAGPTVVAVPHVNIPAAPNVDKGADILDDMLHNTGG
ncbi:MAG TPA: PE-PPE domain-containing protein, partial [Mycobacterium sp.]